MMLLSVLVATVLSGCTLLLFPIIQREIFPYPAASMDSAMNNVHLPWLAIVGTLASWPVLVLGKVWEGRRGEPILRRFLLGLTGLAVGGIAYLLASHLFVPLPELMGNYSNVRSVNSTGIQIPEASTFLLYFALNFALLRWWRLVDPRRSHRLSLWSLFVACIVAFGISIPLEFPQPWGVIVIAITSLSIQLASPLLENSRDDTAYAEAQEAV